MYKKVSVLLDNSSYSLWSLDRCLEMAPFFGSTLIGNHAYATRLHEGRFVQMEPGLPAKYQKEEELQKQRDIHASLIEKGLTIISDSYLDVFQHRCEAKKTPFERRMVEGKNYAMLVKDIEESSYDLVAMGVKGLGEVQTTEIGSVCERVARRIKVDTLITKNARPLKNGHLVVGIDGSGQSYAAMKTAIELSKKMDCRITALAVFDPDFHYKVFDSIAKVLSEEAGEIFKFKEQEKLHEEIIDSGLEKIYADNLELAENMAKKEGVEVHSKVLSGKPYDQILNWLGGKDISMLLIGKVGVHTDNGLDIGSNTENLLRNAPCNVLLVSRTEKPEVEEERLEDIEWTPEAIEMLNRVPGFVRNMVRGHMEGNARKAGKKVITDDMMKEARSKMMGM